jgi:hypothetical protein
MAWDDDCDLLDRAIRDDFGEAIVYHPAVGPAVSIVAPFDEAAATVDVSAGVAIESTAPALTVRLADLPARPAAGDTFTRTKTGKGYEVATVTVDGPGSVKAFAFEV